MKFSYGHTMIRNLTILFLILFIFSGCDLGDPNNSPDFRNLQLDEMIEDTRAISTPLSGSDPLLPDGELDVLSHLGDNRVVGLGLSSFGTSEVFRMAHRLTRYLVEKHGFRGIILANDLGQTMFLDRYITTGQGNPAEILDTIVEPWPWKCREILALLNWMRNYNKGKEIDEMIHIYGYYSHSFRASAMLLDEYMAAYGGDFSQEASLILNEVRGLDKFNYENMLRPEKEAVKAKLQTLYDWIESHSGQLKSASSARQYGEALFLARSLLKTHGVYILDQHADTQEKINRVENIFTCLDLLGKDSKTIALGHFVELYRRRELGNLGEELHQYLGGEFEMAGIMFSLGGFNAIHTTVEDQTLGFGPIYVEEVALKSSLNNIWHKTDLQCFTFEISHIPGDSKLWDWLHFLKRYIFTTHMKAEINNNGSSTLYNQYNLLYGVDTIVYVDYSEPSNLLNY